MELVFKVYTDPVTKNEKEIFRIKVGEDGSFSEKVETNEILYCHSDFGVYTGMLIIEPESDLKLKLPPFREKTALESKNPYFKPILIWLQIESNKKDEANQIVSRLEGSYNQLTSKYFNQLFYQRSTAYLDTVKNKLQGEFGNYQNPVIRNQLAFKLKILESDVNQANQKKVFQGVNPADFLYLNPAFSDLLNLVFENRLKFEANSIKGKELNAAVGKGDIGFIKKYFRENYHLESGLADLVLLKLFYDGYYSNQFDKSAIISILDDHHFSENEKKYIQELTLAVKEKLLFLSPGTLAPVICLKNTEGIQQCSDKIKSYEYIIFADPEMLVCREHLKYLKTVSEKFNNIEFFIVLKYSEKADSKTFITENEIPGIIVWENQTNNFAEVYKIRSYPSAFLLNNKHEVVLAPAKNPLDGFELEFAGLLRNEQIRKFRNQR
ncbi:MAG: hypothetical protein JW833_04705 [Prolixibacteraceae bacterium]|nr:hypothetical protein [Prolixibacteraceae bacterium]